MDLPAEGFLHPALFTDDLDAELEGHDVIWGPAVVEGNLREASHRLRHRPRGHSSRVHGAARATAHQRTGTARRHS